MRKIARYLFLGLLSFFSLYLMMLSGISIFIGFTNIHKTGFWMPILCGGLILFLSIFLIRLILYIIKRARSRDKYLYI